MVERLLRVSIHLLSTKQVVMGSIPGVPHIFGILWIFIPACLIKQPKVHSVECGCKRTRGLNK